MIRLSRWPWWLGELLAAAAAIQAARFYRRNPAG
jgi:hypothetical protein